jgi:hypothetical protein
MTVVAREHAQLFVSRGKYRVTQAVFLPRVYIGQLYRILEKGVCEFWLGLFVLELNFFAVKLIVFCVLSALASGALLAVGLSTISAVAVETTRALQALAVGTFHNIFLHSQLANFRLQSRIQAQMDPDQGAGLLHRDAYLLQDVSCKPTALKIHVVQVLVALNELTETVRDKQFLGADQLSFFLVLNNL